jgi:acyl-CoA thioesterase
VPETPDFPLASHLGLVVDRPGPGRAVARLHASDTHANPHGVVHGAVLFALVDTAMGAATYSVMPEGASCASIEVHLRFLAPARLGDELAADVTVTRAGSRIVHLESRVTAGGDDVVATATGSFAILPPR